MLLTQTIKTKDKINQVFVLLALVLVISSCADEPNVAHSFTQQGAFSGALSSDGTRALVGSIHHGGSLWNTRSNARLFNWNHRANEFSQILAADFSPDNNYAMTADHKTLVLWDTNKGAAVEFWTAPGSIYDLKLTNNGEFALLGMDDFNAVLFNAKYGGVLHEFRHVGPVNTVDISDDGRYAISGSQDLSARIWDTRSGKELQRFDHDNQVNKVAISADGSIAMSAAFRQQIKIWDTGTGKLINEFGNKTHTYSSARFVDGNSKFLLGTKSRLVLLFDIKTGDEIQRWKMPKESLSPYASSVVLDVQKQSKNVFAFVSDGQFFLMRADK
jgi:WD40 repeat protein